MPELVIPVGIRDGRIETILVAGNFPLRPEEFERLETILLAMRPGLVELPPPGWREPELVEPTKTGPSFPVAKGSIERLRGEDPPADPFTAVVIISDPPFAEVEDDEVEVFERRCRRCDCTDYNACIVDGAPCSWVEEDLCSACQAEDLERVRLNNVAVGEQLAAERAEREELVTPELKAELDELDGTGVSPVDVERASRRLTPMERLDPGVALARELGIAGNRVGPYVRMARARSWLPDKITASSSAES
jgi:hypothetical protein